MSSTANKLQKELTVNFNEESAYLMCLKNSGGFTREKFKIYELWCEKMHTHMHTHTHTHTHTHMHTHIHTHKHKHTQIT